MLDNNVKVALVSGASRGIGEAISLRLVREGFFVVGTATSELGAQLIDKKLDNGLGVVLDIRSRESTEKLFLTLKEQGLSPAVLVNNAGITRDNLILRMSEEEWDNVLETNLNGVFRLTKGLVRGMIRARWGRIINIGSVVGRMGNPGQSNYSASKAALEGLTRSLAAELASRNVTVNTVAPGFVTSDMTSSLSEAQQEEINRRIPVGRIGEPYEIAGCVSFLAGEDASYITGQTISVNGGLSFI